MKMQRWFLAVVLIIAAANGLLAQGTNCQANFGYVYSPWLTQPEEPIYLFSDSSTGVDSTTTYLWSFGTGDFSSVRNPAFTYDPEDSGFEQVCLTIHNTSNGCTSQFCDTIRVDNLCIGARYSYTQQGSTFTFSPAICGQADSIRWDFGDGIAVTGIDTITHTYLSGDSFYVCMQVFLISECQYLYPCKVIDCQQIYMHPTGITNAGLQTDAFKIYPDPTTEYISIKAAATTLPAQLVITDVAGHVLIAIQAYNAAHPIDVSHLAAGVYFLQLKTEGGEESVVRRFVKQ